MLEIRVNEFLVARAKALNLVRDLAIESLNMVLRALQLRAAAC